MRRTIRGSREQSHAVEAAEGGSEEQKVASFHKAESKLKP